MRSMRKEKARQRKEESQKKTGKQEPERWMGRENMNEGAMKGVLFEMAQKGIFPKSL